MKTVFKIEKLSQCKVEINGLELEKNWYSDSFAYTDAVTLDLLVKVDSKQKETLSEAAICRHIVSGGKECADRTVMSFSGDGLYKVMHIIMPTIQWLEGKDLSQYSNIYTCKDQKVHKLVDGELVELESLNELIELNFTDQILAYKSEMFVFNLCGLERCFYNIAKTVLDNLCTDKCSSQDILYRDLVWMALNCIQYCIDLGNFYEAQRLLEKVTSCNGICQDVNIVGKPEYSCGCH